MDPHTLVLTPWMAPHRVVIWEVAFCQIYAGKIQVLEEYDDVLLTLPENRLGDCSELATAYKRRVGDGLGELIIRVPSVVVLNRPVSNHKKGVKFSRVNVMTRDNFTCQYCGKKFPMKDLTYDHVVPRIQGGKTEWTNIVTACAGTNGCNSRKGGRTPQQAGMKLLKVPVRPKTLPLHAPCITQNIPDAWVFYLQGAVLATA